MGMTLGYDDLVKAGTTATQASGLAAAGTQIGAVATGSNALEKAAQGFETANRIISAISAIAGNPLVRPMLSDFIANKYGHDINPGFVSQPQVAMTQIEKKRRVI